MTAPTAYELSYDFTAFQVANPTTPLPADKVEIEFNNIQTTTDGLITNLGLIQRADGALTNGIVTFDSLSTTTKALLGTTAVPKGEWVTATVYAVLDLVSESGTTYVCAVAHTSGTFATDLAAGKWMVWSYAGSTDVVTGPASATDGHVAQFDGVTGKVIKGGIAIGTSANNLVRLDATAKLPAVDGSQLTGIVIPVVAGDGIVVDSSDPTAPIVGVDDGGITLVKLGSDVPITALIQNSKSAAYELVLTDAGKHILHPSADTTARILTIPANAAVAFPVGSCVTIINQNGAGVLTLTITSDTMRLAGAGTTGNRTLAANGIATLIKLTTTEWIVSGAGLT
jgi:hypothetical protein